jgi:hypothetical protein
MGIPLAVLSLIRFMACLCGAIMDIHAMSCLGLRLPKVPAVCVLGVVIVQMSGPTGGLFTSSQCMHQPACLHRCQPCMPRANCCAMSALADLFILQSFDTWMIGTRASFSPICLQPPAHCNSVILRVHLWTPPGSLPISTDVTSKSPGQLVVVQSHLQAQEQQIFAIALLGYVAGCLHSYSLRRCCPECGRLDACAVTLVLPNEVTACDISVCVEIKLVVRLTVLAAYRLSARSGMSAAHCTHQPTLRSGFRQA